MARIVERPKARQKLEHIAAYIGTHRPSASRRFLTAARKAYGMLAAMPAMGSLWEPEDPHFADVRYFAIPRYRNYVVSYRPLADGGEILHILHGARDLGALFEAEEP
jgi:toxin ParE1/3/4